MYAYCIRRCRRVGGGWKRVKLGVVPGIKGVWRGEGGGVENYTGLKYLIADNGTKLE